MLRSYIWIYLLSALLLLGCNQSKVTERDTPTSGNIHIAVDETYKSLADSEITVFHSIYGKSKITVDFLPEAYAVQQLLSDSARLIMIGRELNVQELEKFKKLKYDPKYTRIAVDAIAAIVHPKNKTEILDMDQVRNILIGTMTKWEDKGNIQVVLDNQGSGTISFLRDSILKGGNLGKSVFALKNNQEVLEYVAKHENSIGFIGVNLISSFDKDANQQFLSTIKPLGISRKSNDEAFEPYQAYIATRQYPLIRFANLVINEPYNGLGSGFGAFVASDKGQRIILKDGLVPATQPVRLIEMNPTNDPYNSN